MNFNEMHLDRNSVILTSVIPPSPTYIGLYSGALSKVGARLPAGGGWGLIRTLRHLQANRELSSELLITFN